MCIWSGTTAISSKIPQKPRNFAEMHENTMIQYSIHKHSNILFLVETKMIRQHALYKVETDLS